MKIALVGNPNSGKTSIFNVLTGSNQKVGNWPGVTIEKKQGQLLADKNLTLIDLPGIYSLATTSPEENIAKNYLLSEDVDVIVNIVDGVNLERNLYLTMQLLEFNIPVVVAINMADLMKQQNITIDLERLQYRLDTNVVLMSVAKKEGFDELLQRIKKSVGQKVNLPRLTYNSQLETMINEVAQSTPNLTIYDRFKIINLLEEPTNVTDYDDNTKEQIADICNVGNKIFKQDLLSVITNERYRLIENILQFSLYTKEKRRHVGFILDKVLTNQWLAFPIFILIMWLIYYLAIQSIGTIGSDWINDVLFGKYVPDIMTKIMHIFGISHWLQDLVLNGIIAGVGSVIGFLPQIAILFFCLNILDDCGYMARISFVMDRLFRYLGLSGKSIIPLLVSTGCGVPGVMATRTIENADERKMTMMVSTFMPCSAKTAVIALIVGAFFSKQSWVAPIIYCISLLTIVISGLLLKNGPFFRRDEDVFVLELPDYHFPRLSSVFRQTWIKCKSFIKKAASIIFLSSVILWILAHCNWTLHFVPEDRSILASFGRALSFVFIPLGFSNWESTVAVLTSFIAKENIINTLGILYHKTVSSENGIELWQVLRDHYTVYSAFSFLVFNVLCTPCFAAIAALKRELNSIKEVGYIILFQCGMAYTVSFIIYQLSIVFFANHKWTIWTYLAILIIMSIVYGMLNRYGKQKGVKIDG